MQPTSSEFKTTATRALDNADLQRALARAKSQFQMKRAKAVGGLPEFESLRDVGRDIKNHTLAHLDYYLEQFEKNVTAAGGKVRWCADAAEARAAVLDICRKAGARTVTKGKSMIGEEIGVNEHLEKHGVQPIETDLGEYIIQLRKEPPSHIIAPAFHLNKEQWAQSFLEHHAVYGKTRLLTERKELVDEARDVLRGQFLSADVGITGANLLVAETGSSVIVTNEGNGDLTQTLPRVHIALASLEKIVPTLEDAMTVLRLLARSATGQDFSTYTTFSTGPRRPADPDGPEEYHVILLDNGRSSMLGTEFHDMLRCIRCAACMNHCPVYAAVGGHTYGWVYPGPMGSVLTPSLIGVDQAGHLPNASTFCGKCEAVCPMKIPLPKMMRHWREREFERHLSPRAVRFGMRFWGFLASQPALYRLAVRMATGVLGRIGRKRGRFSQLPLAGGWTKHRDLPAPATRTFLDQWRSHEKMRRKAA